MMAHRDPVLPVGSCLNRPQSEQVDGFQLMICQVSREGHRNERRYLLIVALQRFTFSLGRDGTNHSN